MGLKLNLRDGVWYAVGTVRRVSDGRSVRIRKSTTYPKSAKREAEAVLTRLEYETMNSTPETAKSRVHADKTLADGITEYLKVTKPSETTTANLLRWSEWIGERRLLKDLTAEAVMQPFDKALDEGHMQGPTVRRYLNDICAMISVCRQKKFPVSPDLVLVKPSGSDERDRWLTVDERELLIACCDEEIRDAVAFLFYTGARPGEMYKLLAKDVLHERQVVFSSWKGKPKKKRVRSVPLNADIRDLVVRRAEAAAKTENQLVFPNAVGQKWSSGNWTLYFQRAVSRAKLEDFRTYDCRSTFASHLVQNGASLRAVADLLGHTDLKMVMRYAYLAPSHLAAAIDTLSAGSVTQIGTNLTQTPEVVPPDGIEPSASSLPRTRSTPELRRLSEDSMDLLTVPHDFFFGPLTKGEMSLGRGESLATRGNCTPKVLMGCANKNNSDD